MLWFTNYCVRISRACSVVAALALIISSPAQAQLLAGSADLDQARNGGPGSPVSPINWVNGSLNATQAHYREGYSVPYRTLMTGLATGAGNPHSLIIEWDTTKGGKHALDFITHYDRLEPHAATFGHAAEDIDPLAGLAGVFVLTPPDAGLADVIPAPSSTGSPVAGQPTTEFNSLPLSERRITIYNGTITGLSYASQSSPGAGDGSSSLKIDFIANSPNVVVLWGGHIATSLTWGIGNSAAQINGSSYHTRLISLNGASTGNQDRSLSAGAVVVPPPPCGIEGPLSVCPGSTNGYTAPNATNATYAWTISSTCGATFVGGQTTASGQNVSVVACSTCGSYTLTVTVTSQGLNTQCSITVGVEDTTAPTITGSIANTTMQCNGALPAPAANITQLLALITGGGIVDNCTATANLTVTSSDAALTGTACNGSRVRTYTVRDACNNASTITHTFVIQDTTPPTITGTIAATSLQCNGTLPAPATTIAQLLALMGQGASIVDNCGGSMTVTSADGALTGTACNGSRVRTYTVRDTCNNASTITHTFNFLDNTPPTITGTIAAASLQCNGSLPAPATNVAQLLALMNAGASIVDNCGGSMTVTSSDGALTGTACNGSRVRTYTVKDTCNNSSVITHTFNIQDTNGPTVIGTIADATRECSAGLPAAATTVEQLLALMSNGAVISDNCTLLANLTVSHTDSALSGTNCNGTRVRTYRVSDACKNLSPAITQTFHIEDTTAPVITGTIRSSSADCGGTGLPDAATTLAQLLELMGQVELVGQGATITDNCTSNEKLKVSHEDGGGQGEGCSGKLIRTYTVSDSCGNSSTVQQVFSFSDEVPPTIACPQDVTIECGNEFPAKAMSLAELQAQNGDASDDCELKSVEWISDEQISPGVTCPLTYKRTYRATDVCDNTAECTQFITLADSTPPIQCCAATDVYGCVGFPIALQPPIVTDECGLTIVPVGTRSDQQPLDAPFPPGVTTVTWSAADGCGNKAEPFVINVIMNQCPTFTTRTQTEWGAAAQVDGTLVSTLLGPANGGNLFVGRMSNPNPRSVTVKVETAHCLGLRLPASGTSTALPVNFGNRVLGVQTCNTAVALPTWASGKFKNSLMGQTMAVILNIRYDKMTASNTFVSLPLCAVMTTVNQSGVTKSYVIPAGVLSALGNNKTVAGLRELANDGLAGRSTGAATLDAINTALTRVNQMFSGGPVALLSSTCASSATPALVAGPNGHDVQVLGDTAGSAVGGVGVDAAGNPSGPKPAGSNPVNVNDGMIAAATTEGFLKIEGDYKQTQNGSLIVQLRGAEPVSGYDVVSIDGKAFLGGLLMVDLANGYMPQVGDQFEILTASSVAGTFDQVHLAPLADRSYLDVTYGPSAVTIDVKDRPVVKGDLDRNDNVDVKDMLLLMQSWGKASDTADLNSDGTVDAADLADLLANWGSH